MTESLSSLFKKSDMSDLLMIRANSLQKNKLITQNSYFLIVFLLFMPKSEVLPFLFTQEQLWVIGSWQ